MRRSLLALLLASACSPAAPPPPATPAPALTVAVPPAVATETTPPPVVASAPAAAEPPPAPEPPPPDPCRGSAFDLKELPLCKRHQRDEPPSQTSRLAVALVPESPKVRSGESIDVSVVFTNRTDAPLPVNVHNGCATFELGAYDARGVRRDYVVGDCGFGTGCGGSVLRLVVEPGGTLTRHLRFTAKVTRVSSKTQCQDVDAGGLPPGKYTLRATAHMSGWLEDVEGAKGAAKRVTAPIEVTR